MLRFIFLYGIILLYGCSSPLESAFFQSDHFRIAINNQGQVVELTDLVSEVNYVVPDSNNALMAVRKDMNWFYPQEAVFKDQVIELLFAEQMKAKIMVAENSSHISFELGEFNTSDSIDLITWGPYYTRISQTIGETVGVVRDDEFAIGIQSLNLKTLGGYPWNESDRMPAFDIFRQDDPTDMHPSSDGSVLYRVEAAKPTASGSSIQAYCRDRHSVRIVSDFKHERLVALPHDDGGVIGSKIAIFGCPVDQALAHLGEIELAEGLPHPIIDGIWGKQAPNANAAYLITTFSEDNVDSAIDLTLRAGLQHMYHYGNMFTNWGHFDWNPAEFPSGATGLKTCVNRAERRGVKVGTHFLSNFITTNDPYVTPVPDARLALVGSSVLTTAINETQTDITIASPDFFNQMKNNNLKTVRIGDELIRYGQVTEIAPWQLINCQRGAFGTRARAHGEGSVIGKLLDHGYKTFLTNIDLTHDMSVRMADIYNETGLRQISFDGLEGNRSTGLGAYGESAMPYIWYTSLSADLKDHLIIDASRTTHFFWHIFTRMNWGEPWYAGFRESQTAYRFNNQAYFQRNFIPGMLGWFKMTPETSLADMEWLLAKTAGYDAGYALVTNPNIVSRNGYGGKILDRIGDWEKLRLGGIFSDDQKERLRNTELEFELTRLSEGNWNLTEVSSHKFQHEKKELQPGQPTFSSLEWDITYESQPLVFQMTADQADVSEIMLEVDQYKSISIPIILKEGQHIQHKGSGAVSVFSESWQLIQTVLVPELSYTLDPGKHSLTVDASFTPAGASPQLKVELRTVTNREQLSILQTQ